MKPIAEQGYLIVAQNTKDVDYVDCARTLAKTIKYWHPDAQICLLTNEQVGPDVLLRTPVPISIKRECLCQRLASVPCYPIP